VPGDVEDAQVAVERVACNHAVARGIGDQHAAPLTPSLWAFGFATSPLTGTSPVVMQSQAAGI
jgi:hypothetical protein